MEFIYLIENYNYFIIVIFIIFFLNFIKIILWGLGIGDWGLGPIPNPQSPIPNPQSPCYIYKIIIIKFRKIIINIIIIK